RRPGPAARPASRRADRSTAGGPAAFPGWPGSRSRPARPPVETTAPAALPCASGPLQRVPRGRLDAEEPVAHQASDEDYLPAVVEQAGQLRDPERFRRRDEAQRARDARRALHPVAPEVQGGAAVLDHHHTAQARAPADPRVQAELGEPVEAPEVPLERRRPPPSPAARPIRPPPPPPAD